MRTFTVLRALNLNFVMQSVNHDQRKQNHFEISFDIDDMNVWTDLINRYDNIFLGRISILNRRMTKRTIISCEDVMLCSAVFANSATPNQRSVHQRSPCRHAT